MDLIHHNFFEGELIVATISATVFTLPMNILYALLIVQSLLTQIYSRFELKLLNLSNSLTSSEIVHNKKIYHSD